MVRKVKEKKQGSINMRFDMSALEGADMVVMTREQMEMFGQQLVQHIRMQVDEALERAGNAVGVEQRYGTKSQIAKMIGVGTRQMERYLAGANWLEYIRPEDYKGAVGEKRYNIADFIEHFRYTDGGLKGPAVAGGRKTT